MNKYIGFKHYDVASDPEWYLIEWLEMIKNWIAEYGEEAILTTDGGYNNVGMVIHKKK